MTLTIPTKRYARIAGALYLVIAVFGAFAIGYVPSIIVAAGNPATTASNLMANQGLFGLGVFADVVVMLTEIVLSVMLFVLFKPTSPTLDGRACFAADHGRGDGGESAHPHHAAGSTSWCRRSGQSHT
jgi:hypothetical protein